MYLPVVLRNYYRAGKEKRKTPARSTETRDQRDPGFLVSTSLDTCQDQLSLHPFSGNNQMPGAIS